MGRSNGGLLGANALVREVRGARGARRFRAFVAEAAGRVFGGWIDGGGRMETWGKE